MRSRQNISRLAAALCLGALVAGSSAGCRDQRSDKPPRQFFPGMDDQPKYRVQAESDFYPDGRTMREPPQGAVAFGRTSSLTYGSTQEAQARFAHEISLERADLLRNDPRVYQGVNPDGSRIERIPMRELLGVAPDQNLDPALVQSLIEVGRSKFNIFCIVCHGGTGRGDGTVGTRWATPIPSLHDPRLLPGGLNGQDGHIFYTILNGVPNAPGLLPTHRMPPYASQINEREAWAIVAYVRALQRAQTATIQDVPEAQRERLLRTRPAPAPAAAPATGQPAQEGNS